MATAALQLRSTSAVVPFLGTAGVVPTPIRRLPTPWRDPQTVSKVELARHIQALQLACEQNPTSPDLRTCLGMAYAMNFEVYRSMATLEKAVELDDTHFFGQLKLSELYYRVRALPKAEEETLKAVNLAGNGWELNMARKQLLEIRRLISEGSQRPELNKSLKAPTIAFAILGVISCLVVVLAK
ncbi:MAG: hypothetical protein ABI824_05220 [Acidobacteriota bacterium]